LLHLALQKRGLMIRGPFTRRQLPIQADAQQSEVQNYGV
jgi:hypothetical protein